MLRSLMPMHHQKITSVDQWVFTLKTTPIFAILSGFSPDDVPGVGSFYDFFNRLWLASTDSLYDLPIYPRLHRASKHDSVLFVSTSHELKHWYPD